MTSARSPPAAARAGASEPGGTRLAGALAEAFGVQDEYRTGRDLQPATGGEVRQRLVDRLPRGPDQLSQLLLGQVVMNVQPVAFLLTEPGRQVEQVLRHAPGDVGEDQVGHDIVGPAQPPGQRLQHVHGNVGALEQPAAQRVMGERRERRVVDRVPIEHLERNEKPVSHQGQEQERPQGRARRGRAGPGTARA